MRRFVILALLLVPLTASAQEGAVLFERTIKYEFDVPERFRDKIPTRSATPMLLLFNGAASLMKEASPEDKEAPRAYSDRRAQGMALRLRMGSGSRADRESIQDTFVDYENEILTETRVFMGRAFRITDAKPALAWKITGEESTFLGRRVLKATAIEDSSRVEAWFTPEIPAPAGPGHFGGLPGVILVLSVDDARIVYSATEIHLKGQGEIVIELPAEGGAISRAQYEEMVSEKLQEVKLRRDRRRSDRIRH